MHFFAARIIAPPTNSQEAGCAGCALKTTGHPAARAEAVSPPATENAKGKLLAPKTATGPIAICICRISILGKGLRSGKALSIIAFTHEPSVS